MPIKTLVKLAEPKTFTASLIPVFYGSAYAFSKTGQFHFVNFLLLCLGMMLVQGATNMINDYYDYKRKADQNNRADEKALASGEVTLKQLKHIIQGFALSALSIGIYFSALKSWWILLVIVIAITVLYSYSAGPLPLCYTPFGELAAGVTMGLGITMTVIFIQGGLFGFHTLLVAMPTVAFIAALLMANNLSDWREDEAAGRRTSVILLGEKNGTKVWVGLLCSQLIFSMILAGSGMISAWILALQLIAFPYFKVVKTAKIEKVRQNKGRLMGTTSLTGLSYHLTAIMALIITGLVRWYFGYSI